jgi:cellulose synthase/poly-beta-1,6-N-acetylglucosamine synthase-like glycosyltransferase
MGTTLVAGSRFFDKFQSLDWVLAQALLKMASDAGYPLTAMGNNMMVTREAYEATGGYQHLPFSITEDYALCQEIISRNYKFDHLVHSQVLAFTQPMLTLQELLQQRKRWMYGAFQLPFFIKLIMLIPALFLPGIVVLLFVAPVLAVSIWLIKLGVQSAIMLWMLLKLKQFRLMPYILLFEPYYVFISFASLVNYYIPGKVLWKGREYSVTGN